MQTAGLNSVWVGGASFLQANESIKPRGLARLCQKILRDSRLVNVGAVHPIIGFNAA